MTDTPNTPEEKDPYLYHVGDVHLCGGRKATIEKILGSFHFGVRFHDTGIYREVSFLDISAHPIREDVSTPDAPLTPEIKGLLELAESIAGGLESGDIVLIDEHGAPMAFVEETLPSDDMGAVMLLTEAEADFMRRCSSFDGLIVYPHQAVAMAMAGHLETGGLVTVDRVGPFWIVSAVRGEGEEW